MTAVWFILVAAALGGWLGDRDNAFQDLQVPQWFSENATTTTAIITGVVAPVVMLAAGFLGGIVGARYHQRADAYLAAEERDRLTGGEPLETVDAAGDRHVTGQGPALATERTSDRDLARGGQTDDHVDLRDRTDDVTDEPSRVGARREDEVRGSDGTEPHQAAPGRSGPPRELRPTGPSTPCPTDGGFHERSNPRPCGAPRQGRRRHPGDEPP